MILIPAFFTLFSSNIQVEAKEDVESTSEDKSNYENLKTFSEVLSLIESTYVEKVSSEKLIEGAIHGLVKSLDPHTSYMPPEVFEEMKVQTSGKFGGLGIEVSMRNAVLTVISPIEGTPAFRAGIQAKDKIIKIEEDSTLDMTLQDAVSRLRGEIGSPVTITIIRYELKVPLVVKIFRDTIAGNEPDPESDDYLILLSEGRLVNLGNATGHPSRIMDGSFANQVLAQMFLYEKQFASLNDEEKKKNLIKVEVLPKKLDEEVASYMVQGFGGTITKLTKEQAEYINVPEEGPFKTDIYKY